MNSITIRTNGHHKEILNWWDLTPKEQKEFGYRTPGEWEENGGSFFRYGGQVYDLGEFARVSEPMASNCQFKGLSNWGGYQSDSFFSGILVKYADECETVIVATFIS